MSYQQIVMAKLRLGFGHMSGNGEDVSPSVGPTGDPVGLDPSEVPDDVPISLLHGSSF